MMDKAPINKMGQKVIPYDDYVLSEEDQSKIIEKVLKKEKVPYYLVNEFRFTVTLGCSPRYTPKK